MFYGFHGVGVGGLEVTGKPGVGGGAIAQLVC